MNLSVPCCSKSGIKSSMEPASNTDNKPDPNKWPIACLGVATIVIAAMVIKADPAVEVFWNWYYCPVRTAPDFQVIVRVSLEYILLALGFCCLVSAMFVRKLRFLSIVSVALQSIFFR